MIPTTLFKRYVGKPATIEDVIKDCLELVKYIETQQKTIESLEKKVQELQKD